MSQFEIPLISLIFFALLTIVYISRPKIILLENKAYEVILVGSGIIVSLGTVVHLICSFNDYQVVMNQWFSFITLINIILMSWFVVVFLSILFYVIIITYPKSRENVKKILIPFGLFAALFVISVSFFKLELVQVGNIINVSGPMFYYSLTVIGLILFASILISLFNFKKIDRRYYAIFGIIAVLGIMLILINVFPEIILYDFSVVLFCYIMYFTIENPDKKMLEQVNILKREAESGNLVKEAFLQQMSHEIATPMTHAMGLNDLNKEATNLKEIKENSIIIDEKLNLINDIALHAVTMSGIVSGDLKLEITTYKTEDLLKRVDKIIDKCPKNLKFVKKIDKNIPKLLDGDNTKVINIFEQLLSNAFKFTKEGTVTLEVTSEIKDDKCILTIRVIDTGIGIKKEYLKSLFDAFERPHWKDDQAVARGTGLGLSIAKKLTELMNGDIAVQSKYGQGSEFTVKIEQGIVGRS